MCLFLSTGMAAQEKFTDHLKRKTTGEGTVILHHDAVIEELVNGRNGHSKMANPKDASGTSAASGGQKTDAGAIVSEDAETVGTKVSKVRTRSNGYRIQVYSGGNSRNARQEATRVGNRVKTYFADLPVYTHFYSPRWICRVGDFKTYEEANEMLRQLKETKQFNEAVIVKSKIVMEY